MFAALAILNLGDFLRTPLSILANRATLSLFLFCVFVGLRDRLLDAGTLVPSLRSVAGLDEASFDVSYGNDVEDELALQLRKPVANPGTATRTKFSYLHRIILPFGVSCGVFFKPMAHSYEYPCSSHSLPFDKIAGSPRGFAPS